MPDQRETENIHTRAPFDDRTTRTRVYQRRLFDIVHRQTRAGETITHITAQPAGSVARLQKFHEQILQQEFVCLITMSIVERQAKQFELCRAKA